MDYFYGLIEFDWLNQHNDCQINAPNSIRWKSELHVKWFLMRRRRFKRNMLL